MAITLAADHEYAATYIANGTVRVKGFDVQPVWPEKGAGAMYGQVFKEPQYDVVLLPLTNFLIAMDKGVPITGIPVFPDVFFPHLGAQVNKQAGIHTPKDLEGKRVGIRGYGFNPATWLRGALADVYGVDLRKITWVEAEPNSLMSVDYPRGTGFKVEKGGDQTKELESGELDAVFYDRVGPALTANTARLFDDPLGAAKEYYAKTGVFPVNVVLAAKNETLAANPGLGQAVVDASDEARDLYYKNVKQDDSHMGFPIWWLRDNGLFPHRNGLQANYKALEAIIRYSRDAGIIQRDFKPEDVFFKGAK